MVVIYAEKADVANKIAAALGGFTLPGGTKITFANLKSNEKVVKSFQNKQGYLETSFKGKPCKVTWGYGHMYALYDVAEYNSSYKHWRDYPECFIPEEFKLHAVSSSIPAFNAKLDQQRKIVKELFKEAEYIINATDFDREGELIFAYVYEANKCKKPFKRAHFTSQTEEGIKEAFDKLKPSSEIYGVEKAGRARSVYDWLIGINLTTRITLKNPGNNVLSVGRVQTPVLKMIVDRELAIRGFKSEPFWTIEATFTTSKKETYKGKHSKKRFEKKKDTLAVINEIKGKNGVVTEIKSERTTRKAPLLYSLSALQMDANDKYGFTAEDTLNIAQYLYDNGYTTYPRSKSQYLNDDMRPVVVKTLEALQAMPEYKTYLDGMKKDPDKRYFDSSKVDSHFAIISTTSTPKSLNDEQRKIYDLIAKSVIRMIYPDAVLENTTVTTAVDKHDFISKGTVIIKKGWMAVDVKTKEELLPSLAKGEKVSGEYECKEGKTEPPKRYTDKTLIAAMKAAGKDLPDEELAKIMADPKVEGIGTEATRAEIINTLIKRDYIERKGKQFHATEKGISFIGIFPITELMSPEFTARMEKELTAIADNKGDYDKFIEQVKNQTINWCSIISKSGGKAMSGETKEGIGKCPLCGGSVLEFHWGWGCTEYKSGCKFSINKKIAGKEIPDAAVKKLLELKPTNVIKGFKSKTGSEFEARLKLDEGKVVFDFGSGPEVKKDLKCPICGKNMVEHSWGWGCSGYKEGCKFSVGKKICGKAISEAIVKRIIKDGNSGVIKGFVSKAGNKFDAELKREGEKVNIVFQDKKAAG
ncbi:MAG: DNA topoisomerase III [Clostridiales bacterium]|nr:DNA topoisomerase III [Clostridiales bacterium]